MVLIWIGNGQAEKMLPVATKLLASRWPDLQPIYCDPRFYDGPEKIAEAEAVLVATPHDHIAQAYRRTLTERDLPSIPVVVFNARGGVDDGGSSLKVETEPPVVQAFEQEPEREPEASEFFDAGTGDLRELPVRTAREFLTQCEDAEILEAWHEAEEAADAPRKSMLRLIGARLRAVRRGHDDTD